MHRGGTSSSSGGETEAQHSLGVGRGDRGPFGLPRVLRVLANPVHSLHSLCQPQPSLKSSPR